MRRLALLSTLLATRALADPSAATTLQVRIDAHAEALGDHRLRMTYRITNLDSSSSALEQFWIVSPVPPAVVSAPGAPGDFVTSARAGNEDVAAWGWTGDYPGPSQSSPALTYEASGLPGLVQFRADRYAPVPMLSESEIVDPETDPRVEDGDDNAVFGTTVGVVPLPTGQPVESLTAQLRSYVESSCRLRWIDNPGICTSLETKVRAERGSLQALLHELDAQRGKHVQESAYSLLSLNAQYLISRL